MVPVSSGGEKQGGHESASSPSGEEPVKKWPKVLTLCSAFAFLLGLEWILYEWRKPLLTPGAFALSMPVITDATLGWAVLQEAKHSTSAIDEWYTYTGPEEQSARAAWESVGEDGAPVVYVWRHIVLFYEEYDATNDWESLLETVHSIEVDLVGRWQPLCSQVPESMRLLCNPGDSLAGAAYGFQSAVSPEASAAGVLRNVTYAGEGDRVMPVENVTGLLDVLRASGPDGLASVGRWLPQDHGQPQDQDDPPLALRSTFAFYLPEPVARTQWPEVMLDEVWPVLVEENQILAGRIKVLYEVDGIAGFASFRFSENATHHVPYLVLGTLIGACVTLLVTQRLVLSLVTFVISTTVPVSCSLCLAKSGVVTERTALPLVAFASWSFVAVGCVDLHCAAARASEVWSCALRRPSLGWIPGAFDWSVPAARAYEFVEASLPQLVVALSLGLLSLTGRELPLLAEFAQHAGLGLFVAVLLSTWLAPVAVSLGDAFHDGCRGAERRGATASVETLDLNDAYDSGGKKVAQNLLPWECGARHTWSEKAEAATAKVSRDILTSLPWAILVLLANIAVVIFAALTGFWPQFQISSGQMFEGQSFLEETRAVKARFGPQASPDALARQLAGLSEEFLVCTDGAGARGCDVHFCENSLSRNAVEPATCGCSFSRSGSSSECSGVFSRVYGYQDSPMPEPGDPWWSTYWAWVNKSLIANEQASLAPGLPTSMEQAAAGIWEFWTTGEQMVQPQFQGTYGSSAGWLEDPCVRVLCFCGYSECDMEASSSAAYSWAPLCTGASCSLTLPKSARRLQDGVGPDADASAEPPSEPDGTPEVDLLDIYVVFGLWDAPGKEMDGVSEVDLRFNNAFNMALPDVQRSTWSLCAGTHPDLQVVSVECWLIDFKAWLESEGFLFPVPQNQFYDRFAAFVSATDDVLLDRFWLSEEGAILGFYAVLRAPRADLADTAAYEEQWMSYMGQRLDMAPLQATPVWFVIPEIVQEKAASALNSIARGIVWQLLLVLGLAVLLVTLSGGLCLMAELAAIFALLVTSQLAAVSQSAAGALEVVMLAAAVCALLGATLRVAFQYSLAQDGPGPDPNHKESIQALFKLQSVDARRTREQKSYTAHHLRPLWLGAVRAERARRIAACLTVVGSTLLADSIAAALALLYLTGTLTAALSRVGAATLAGYLVALLSAFWTMPVLMRLGFAPSRIRWKAMLVLLRFQGQRRGVQPPAVLKELTRVKGDQATDELTRQDAELAADVLGWPFSRMLRPSAGGPKESKEASAAAAAAAEEVGEEGGQTILGLDVHHATAMPPYHIAVTVRDRFHGKG